ncbi:MAG: hypothetical protein MJH10_09615 [Epibacterium sp.]|nr:hypothetical protein [Epibacterium sp.]NQX73792.1 hypothetical protein [Epibacterium sp.]
MSQKIDRKDHTIPENIRFPKLAETRERLKGITPMCPCGKKHLQTDEMLGGCPGYNCEHNKKRFDAELYQHHTEAAQLANWANQQKAKRR